MIFVTYLTDFNYFPREKLPKVAAHHQNMSTLFFIDFQLLYFLTRITVVFKYMNIYLKEKEVKYKICGYFK